MQTEYTEKEKWAAYMREYGRKNGAQAVKGVLITCARCGSQTEKQHFSHEWCADCVKPAQLERRRARLAAKGAETVGSSFACRHCGAATVKTHKRQFYCAPCGTLSAASALPETRAVQRQYQGQYARERRTKDPAFVIRERISSQIGGAIRSQKAGRRWEILVGYKLPELMAHLERQFLKGMSWDNRRDWHIDHIVSLTNFDFSLGDDEVRRAWALSNLRPLWASENIRKSARRTHLC